MIRFSASFVVTALAVLASSGCDDPFGDRSCTLIGCANGAHLTVARVGAWAEGEHRLAVQLDAREYDCRFTLPLPPEARANEVSLPEQQLACTPELPSSFAGVGAVVYRAYSPQTEGCPPDADASAGPGCGSGRYTLSLHIGDLPASVALRLTLGDAVLLDEQRTLEYQTSYPNGPDCGGPCRTASLTFDVEEP